VTLARRERFAESLRKAAPYLVPLALSGLAWPLLSPLPAVGDNFQFWLAGHMVATGQSPYDRGAWEAATGYGVTPGGIAANTVPLNLLITHSVWLYPPQTAFLFVPFGLLPFEVGVPLFHIFVLLAALAGVSVAAAAIGLTGARLAMFLALATISQPFVISVRDGHPIGLIVLGAALAYVGVRDGRALMLAAGVVLLSLKPQLVIPFGIGLLVWLAIHRRWRAIAISAVALSAITLPAELVDPFPFSDLVGAASDRLGADLSTTAALARDLGGGVLLTLVLAASAAVACAMAVWRSTPAARPNVLFAASLLLSLVLIPYSHDYDLLLCLPAGAAALSIGVGARRASITVFLALAIFLVPWLLFYAWPLLGQGDRKYLGGPLGAAPLIFTYVLAVVAWLSTDEPAPATRTSSAAAIASS
jgi:hypothetical protein